MVPEQKFQVFVDNREHGVSPEIVLRREESYPLETGTVFEQNVQKYLRKLETSKSAGPDSLS